MIADQGVRLVRLAKDILEVGGVSPGEPIWITPAGVRGQYTVQEGNRRVTALKLLENPALADGTGIEKQFRRLAKSYADNPIRELDARLFATRDDVLPWMRRRHMTGGTGVGLDRWKVLAKGRANRENGHAAPTFLAVVELLEDDQSTAWAETFEALDARWSTVDRVLEAAPFTDVLGVSIDPKTGVVTFENGDQQAGRSLLKRVLGVIADPDFKFERIEKKEDRAKFIQEFAEYSVKSSAAASASDAASPTGSPLHDEPENIQAGAVSAPTPEDIVKPAASPAVDATDANSTEAANATRRAVADANRKKLAPPDGPRLLPVHGLRLAPLYKECRQLTIKNNENAAAFLVRVFIELSSEVYLCEKNVKIPPSLAKKKGVTSWDDYKITLSEKISAVAYDLDPSNKNQVFQQARVMIQKDAPGPFSITTLHAYFHNRFYLPDADAIRQTWDGWEAYLNALHSSLSEP